MPGDHPRKLDIDYAAGRGWFEGFEDGTFRPDQVVTASQIAALVGRVFAEVSEEGVDRLEAALFMQHGDLALSNPTEASVEAPVFSDFPPPGGHEGHEAVDASVAYAAARGWFVGYPDGTFRPYRVISAGQVAAVAGRAFAEGVSRAEMAAFVRRGNLAVVAHEASLAWDDVGVRGAEAQDAWNRICGDVEGILVNSTAAFEIIREGYVIEVAAEDAAEAAWRADVVFWETLAERGEAENDALAKASAAADAWAAAAASERRVIEDLDEVIAEGEGTASVETAGAARVAETAAWKATTAATDAARIAESRAEESVRAAWSEAAAKAEAAETIWEDLPPLTNLDALADSCRDWTNAWPAWEDWAAAMSTANDALAAVA